MVEASQGNDLVEDMLEGVDWSVPLEGDVVPLEDCEEGDKLITTATLVGKVLCTKTLNKGTVNTIVTKA